MPITGNANLDWSNREFYDPRTNMLTPAGVAEVERNRVWNNEETARNLRGHRRLVNFGKIASVAIPTAGVGLSAMGVGAPAVVGSSSAPAAWSMPGVSAPSFGAPAAAGVATGAGGTVAPVVAPLAAKAGISSMFTSPLASTLAQGAFSLIGQRSQNKAADQARRDTLAANAEALKLQREQLEMETRNADLDREELRAQNAAINELKKRELDAAEEVRAFDREQAMYLRSKDEATETRRAPYRQAGTAALGRLMSMWGL